MRTWPHEIPCPRVHCVDGFSMSVQVGPPFMCRRDTHGRWVTVEIALPSKPEPLLEPFNFHAGVEDVTPVYCQVPVTTLATIVDMHGGILEDSYQELRERKVLPLCFPRPGRVPCRLIRAEDKPRP